MPFIPDRTQNVPFIIKRVGGAEKIQDKTIVAGEEAIVVEPDQGFDALSSVTIIPNPMLEYYKDSTYSKKTNLYEAITVYNEEVATE